MSFTPASVGAKSVILQMAHNASAPLSRLTVRGRGIAGKPLSKEAKGEENQASLPTKASREALENRMVLEANYPNPFNPSTTIPYVLAEAGWIKLNIYNLLGQEVRVLVDQLQVPGSYRVSWDGQDDAGRPVSSGTYLYRLEAGSLVQVAKMTLAR